MDYLAFLYAVIPFITHSSATSLERSSALVGFFSACFNRTNRTNLHRKAGLYYNTTESRVHLPCVKKSDCNHNITIHYESYDVCEDHEKLRELFLTLMLGEEYNDIKTNDSDEVVRGSKMILMVTFLTPRLQKLIFEIDLTKEPIIIAVFNEDALPTPLTDSRTFTIMENTMHQDVLTISRIITNFNWEKVGLLHLRNDRYSTEVYSNLYREFLLYFPIHHPNICFYRGDVNMLIKTDFEHSVKTLQREYLPNVVVLFGTQSDQISFLNVANEGFHTKHIWILLDIELRNLRLTSTKKNIISLKNLFRLQMVKIQPALGQIKEKNVALTKVEYIKIALNNAIGSKILFIDSKKWRLKTTLRLINNVNFESYISNEYGSHYLKIGTNTLFYHEFHNDYKELVFYLRTSRCKKFVCSPGWYQTTGILLQQQTQWDVEYGWTCRKCLRDHFKAKNGNSSCVPCPPNTLSNEAKTKCYDPYKNIFLEKNLIYVFCFTLSIMSMVWTTILVIAFFIYRKTPIGKSTDLVMTVFHFIVNLSLHAGLFYTQHMEPSTVNCIASVICSGSVYNLFVSVALMKSHKLLKAFSSKRRATEKDKKITLMQQLFTIAISLAISIILIVVTFAQDFPSVAQSRDSMNYLIYYSCSNLTHVFVQMAYGMVLQICCFVTAYRGRNLPNVFNESMSMVYSSFITTIITAVMFVVQIFQKDPLVAPIITWTVLSMNSLIYLILLYARKVYIMLFRKEKNTVSYVQKQTFSAMKNSSKNI